MSFQHPAHYNYQEFIIRHSGAIFAATTLIGHIFPKLAVPWKSTGASLRAEYCCVKNVCMKTQFHLKCAIFGDGTGIWKTLKHLWNIVRSKKTTHSDTEHWLLNFIISLCCTITPIYASLNTNAPLHTVTVFCYGEGKQLYVLKWFGFDWFICQSTQSHWTHQF